LCNKNCTECIESEKRKKEKNKKQKLKLIHTTFEIDIKRIAFFNRI
jgi:predicted GIY-YIG superfamily endonuclease